MNKITKEALDFLNEAREQLSKNPDFFTYRDKEANYIALRTGMFDDSIMIYELGEEVGNFVEQLPRQSKSLIDTDDLLKYQKLRDEIRLQLDKIKIFSSLNPNSDFNKGYKEALESIAPYL